ncbi:MAG TPA: chemotaxis protein CheW [Thermoanaerobaculia bacterium]|jgi:chemotaxis signal transduction protein|nr:chemotaxis protein CheW [Thermoanaerobaculia bacterium]
MAIAVLGAERFAVDLDALEGIERTDLLQLSPAEGGVSGWLLGAREDVPVWSLARLFGRPEGGAARTERAVLMVPAAGGGGRFGLLVDRVERFEAPPRGVHTLPAPFVPARVAGFCGVVRTADGLLLLLDPQALRPDREGVAERSSLGVGQLACPRAEASSAPTKNLTMSVAGAPTTGRVLIAELLAHSADGRRVALALGAAQVREVIGAQAIVPVPGAPDHLPGLVLWRDRPLPVLDLARRLGGPDRLSASGLAASRFVVASAGVEEVALPVGRDVRFERLPLLARPLRLPPELAVPEVLGGYDLAGSLLLVFDLARSLASVSAGASEI